MGIESNKNIKQVAYWQRISVAVLALFLLIAFGSTLFFFLEFLDRGPSLSRLTQTRTPEFIFFVVIFLYLALCFFLTRFLYLSYRALQGFLRNEDLEQLQISFKRQRQFWQGLAIAIASLFLLVIFLAFILTASVSSEPAIEPIPVEESAPVEEG